MTLGALLFIGAGIGIVIGALAHPMIFAAIFGGKVKSRDHDESDQNF